MRLKKKEKEFEMDESKQCRLMMPAEQKSTVDDDNIDC